MDFIKSLINLTNIQEDISKNPSWYAVLALIIVITAAPCIGFTYLFVEKLNDNQIKDKQSSIEVLEKRNQGLKEEKQNLTTQISKIQAQNKDLKMQINKKPNAPKKEDKYSFPAFHQYFNFVKGYSGVDFWIPFSKKDISQFQSIKLYINFDKPNTIFKLCIYDDADDSSCEEINFKMGIKNNLNSNERIISLPLKKFSVERSHIKKITFHVQKDNKKPEDYGFSVTKIDFE